MTNQPLLIIALKTLKAKPGQYWGKKPIEKRVKVGDSYGLVIESDPSKGGDIQEVTLRGRVLEDFK